MHKPSISVVLGSYNRLPFLKLAINSICTEIKNLAHEIIVVDGGSDDGTLQWLTEQKNIITIIQHNRGSWQGKKIERRSWGYFMNLAFKCAQGKYICMLSDDCLVVPDAIINGYNLFEQQRTLGKNVGAVAFYWRDYTQGERYHVGYTLSKKMYVNHGMYLTEALKAVDYLDEETFFFYHGDGDICLKLWHRGYECIASEDSYIEHYPHANPAVRKTNYQQFKLDTSRYFKKWEGIYYDRVQHVIGKIEEKQFDDRTRTADQFKQLHQKTIAQHPEITKPKPFYHRPLQRCMWIYRALVRRFLG